MPDPAPDRAAGDPAPDVCPECGARFACGATAGRDDCWCFELPPVLPVPEGDARCLCPACLARRAAAAAEP